MNKEERIKKFDKEQLEILLNNLQDIDKFTGFKDGAFKYELGKYQADLLVNCIKKYKEVIDEVIGKEEEIMYLANKVAITAQNIEVKAVRDRLEDIFEILKGDGNE